MNRICLLAFLLVGACADVKLQRTDSTQQSLAADDSILAKLPPGRVAFLPSGERLELYDGALVQTDSGDFGLEYYERGTAEFVRMTRIVGHSAEGKPIQLVLDRVRIVPYSGKERLVMGFCRRAGRPDQSLFAVVPASDDSILGPARLAWQVDILRKRIAITPPTDVSCINEGWGVN